MANSLFAGGKLLFTAPAKKMKWEDVITEIESRSDGAENIKSCLLPRGLSVIEEFEDEGENHFYHAMVMVFIFSKIIGIFPIILLNLHMNLLQNIRDLSSQPLTHQLLSSLLKEYKRPNDKIHELISAGIIDPVKKGLYLPSTKLSERRTEPFLLANHLLGPSYVSFDSALSYYGLIPERVFEVSSATTKPTRCFDTRTGTFSFTRMPLPYYSFGIRQVEVGENQNALIASPEKALFDKIVNTAGVKLRSKIAAGEYLIENLRMDEDQLKQLDVRAMESWLDDAPKRESLAQVIKLIIEL